MTQALGQVATKMSAAGVDPLAQAAFVRYWTQLSAGALGVIPEHSIEPLDSVPDFDEVNHTPQQRRDALAHTCVIKLNGGLGTSMGLHGPKSALQVRDGLTFLDIIAKQVVALRRQHDVRLPLLFMNSFRTQKQTGDILGRYPELGQQDLPLDFVQNRVPKLRADDLSPISWPRNPELEWCPPGHGDLFSCLAHTGLLDRLRGQGVRFAFISNADNLGATCDPDIAAWLMHEEIPYVAEVCDRTSNDRKGGHLARRKSDGRLVLRESAMVTAGDQDFFQDIARHRYFHTNNLWIDLDFLHRILKRPEGLQLPMVVNRKTVDPTDATSPRVIHLESAMGAAVELFSGSQALRVPRERFRPVKSTSELLLARSDIFDIDEDSARLVSLIDHPEPTIRLGEPFAFIEDFERHFASGVPSLRDCTSLTVADEVTFGAQVRCIGDVHVAASDDGERQVPAHTVLTGRSRW